MAYELTIDLGDDFAPVEDPAQRRERSGRSRRSLVVVTVGVAAALALAGSAVFGTPLAPKVTAIRAAPGGVFMVVGDEVMVADIRDGHNAMTAYSLPSGRQLWSTNLTVVANDLDLERIGDVVIAAFHGLEGAGDHTNAVDLRSGAMVWHSAGELWQAYPETGEALMTTSISGGRELISMVDVATGQARWLDREPAGCNSNLSTHLVHVCADSGELTVLDLATGASKASRAIDLGVKYGFAGTPQSVLEIKLAEQDGVIVVGHLGDPGPWMDGYSTDDLKHLWRIPFFDSAYIQACGQIFCMSDGRISTGLDPHTGKTLPFPGFDVPEDTNDYVGAGPAGMTDQFALIPAGSPSWMFQGPGESIDAKYANASSVPKYTDSVGIHVPDSTSVSAWLASVHFTHGPPAELDITPLQRLPGVGVQSCVLVAGYLVCGVDRIQLTFYDVSKLTK